MELSRIKLSLARRGVELPGAQYPLAFIPQNTLFVRNQLTRNYDQVTSVENREEPHFKPSFQL